MCIRSKILFNYFEAWITIAYKVLITNAFAKLKKWKEKKLFNYVFKWKNAKKPF